MSEPERWTDEWLNAEWQRHIGQRLVVCPPWMRGLLRAIAREAMEEAGQIAAEYDDHVCFTEKVCDSKAGCAASFAIRARAKEICGER